MTVREVLHAHIPSLTLESTFRDAVDKMDIYQFPALMILDQDQKPLAVITEGDICRKIQKEGKITVLSDIKAHLIATKPVCFISPELSIEEALDQMLTQNLRVLAVVENERLSGIVLRVDLIQAILMKNAYAERAL